MSVGMAVAKRVSQPSPTSTVIVIGLGSAYDLPTKVDDWRWRLKFRNRTMNPPNKDKPTMPPTMPPAHFYEDHDIIHESKPDFLISEPWSDHLHHNIWTSKPDYKDILLHKPMASHTWRKSYNTPYYWKPPKSNIYRKSRPRPIPAYEEWMDHPGHRERRQIFNSLEVTASKFGLDVKTCILRTICEAKHFLLPPGKSLIQDIIRILFDIPAHPHWKDEYSTATRHKEEDCRKINNPWSNNSHQKVWNRKPSYKETLEDASHSWREGYKDPYFWYSSKNRIQQLRKTIPLNKEWMAHTGYRERREIFDSIKKAAQMNKIDLDVKSCILRTICEVKHFLLPPGKSLIQDIIRILFSIPTQPHWKDEYNKAARHKKRDCKEIYRSRCPISVLELVLQNQSDLSKL
ncbi:unnamed protein product [Hermetia illucens]|uniref:Uncharacterized protein n=1 Tax=Hermetia illucens TaxID=343691 RepID=A0A7R8UCI4_HERIL|nr:unnamed protein product [Hermetia illucens]